MEDILILILKLIICADTLNIIISEIYEIKFRLNVQFLHDARCMENID